MRSAVPPWLDAARAGTPPLRVRDRANTRSDTQLPDNGGVSGAAYWLIAFGARLPDPVRAGAGTGFSPPAGSLGPALARTRSVRRRSRYRVVSDSIL